MDKKQVVVVKPARAYSVFFWISAVFWSLLIGAVTAGLGLLLFPFFIWYKLAVINRTRAFYRPGEKAIIFHRGRWFVRDEDAIPVKSIDNIKLDKSVLGNIFGWVNIRFMTRSDDYRIKYVDRNEAMRFRNVFIDET